MYLRIVKARGSKGVQHEYVRLVEIDLGNGTTKQNVTRSPARAARILSAVGIDNR